MSKKRYTFECDGNNCQIFENNVWLKIEEVVGLLNEQQATLDSLKEENEKLKQESDKYRVMINANASLNDELYEQLKKTEKSYKECNLKDCLIANLMLFCLMRK